MKTEDNERIKKGLAILLSLWITGMAVDFLFTGNVLIGGFIGATLGFIFAIHYNFTH